MHDFGLIHFVFPYEYWQINIPSHLFYFLVVVALFLIVFFLFVVIRSFVRFCRSRSSSVDSR